MFSWSIILHMTADNPHQHEELGPEPELLPAESAIEQATRFIVEGGAVPSLERDDAQGIIELLKQMEDRFKDELEALRAGQEVPAHIDPQMAERFSYVFQLIERLEPFYMEDDDDDDDDDDTEWYDDEDEILANLADRDYIGLPVVHDDDMTDYDVVKHGLAGSGEDSSTWRTDEE